MIPLYVKIVLLSTFIIIKVNCSYFWYMEKDIKIPINTEISLELPKIEQRIVMGVE